MQRHAGGYREALTEALRTGPYGRCVYFCDNNVNDHQTVNMQFGGEGCPTAVLTMNAFTRSMKRKTVVSGLIESIKLSAAQCRKKILLLCSYETLK